MYHTPSNYAGFGMDEDTFSPVGLELPPIAGYGTLTLPAMSGYHGFGNPASPAVPVVQASPPPPPSGGPVPPQGQPVQLGKGAALLIGGLVLAGVGIIGYFAYQELQLRKKIVEKGGGEALAKYELGRAAGTAASALFGSSAQPNRRKRKAKRNRSRRRY